MISTDVLSCTAVIPWSNANGSARFRSLLQTREAIMERVHLLCYRVACYFLIHTRQRIHQHLEDNQVRPIPWTSGTSGTETIREFKRTDLNTRLSIFLQQHQQLLPSVCTGVRAASSWRNMSAHNRRGGDTAYGRGRSHGAHAARSGPSGKLVVQAVGRVLEAQKSLNVIEWIDNMAEIV